MKKRSRLLSQFALTFIIFAVIIAAVSGVATYFAQMRAYREMSWNTIEDVGAYLEQLIKQDPDDFLDYTKYYKEHFEEIRIPYDFTEYHTARRQFDEAFAIEYPGLVFKSDIMPSEMTDELKLLYYTYRHEYWILTFEEAREAFDLPYTYFLTMKEETWSNVYQIDGERTEDEDHPGYLYLGDEYYEDPATHELLWTTWQTGQKQNDVYEWDNEWGKTYSYYTPLVIHGRKVGLIVAEIDVADVNRGILLNSLSLVLRITGIFFVGILLLLYIINSNYISKIHFLADKIEHYGKTRDPQTVTDIRSYSYGNDEIGALAEETANMISEIETHEDELERAAKMKTDFLANMSHEIRTPMNAVIGMAEMALREKIPDAAKNYIGQIKSSGRILLTIINDILDFSKIESGKMEILPAEYVPMSMFNDVSNIIMMRLGGKDVELFLDIAPDIPSMLYGDNIRIRQIMINLANNAVKFTEKGSITISAISEPVNDNETRLTIAVRDTGIGIREEDLSKIFDSFSQVDSKRNRSVEGTGLGLAISQRLVTLMGGTLNVTSTYGEGSTFSFTIPQRIVENVPGVSVPGAKECIGISLLSNRDLSEHFKQDSCSLGVISYILESDVDLMSRMSEIMSMYPGCSYFVFIEESMLTPDRIVYLESEPDIVVIMVTGFGECTSFNMSNIVQIQKPLSTMNLSMIYNREKLFFNTGDSEDGDFTAPDANVMIVDDNAVNLAVAEGLLEPLEMSIRTAESGSEAIKLAGQNKFDIIFMDHMMPEMDGVEATQRIREEYPDYKEVPIIALTANAIGNARDRFLSVGLSDFIAKPIEVTNLLAKVREWLPKDKIIPIADGTARSNDNTNTEESTDNLISSPVLVIGDLDTSSAIAMIGSEKVYLNVLKEYHRVMEAKSETIKNTYEAKDWPAYTIEVHALKSASRQIGAGALADMAASLEKAGKETDAEYIEAHTDEMLKCYMDYKPVLDDFFSDEDNAAGAPVAKKTLTREVLAGLFEMIRTAADELDLDTLETAAEVLDEYDIPDSQISLKDQLKDAIGNIDTDACLDIIGEWESL